MQSRGVAGHPFVLDAEIDAPPGITILFGASGAGKSTLLDCVAGLARPDEGRIVIGERTLFDSRQGIDLPPRSRRIAYVFQSLALFPHLTVEQNTVYGLADLPADARRERVAGSLEAFRVSHLRSRKPGDISGGERQRVALARSLVTQPDVLLLDEPLTGLDAPLKSAILADLRAWNVERKIPVLYVTHGRDEVDALGERVISLENGKVVSSGTPQEVLEAPRRHSLAQLAGFENLLEGTVISLREKEGTMRVRLGGACEIETPLGHARVGDAVRLAIRAGDILLASQRPAGLSARNVLPGRIVSLERRAGLVLARVDCGVEFAVHVTPGAVRELRLSSGGEAWLVLKTHSCQLVEG